MPAVASRAQSSFRLPVPARPSSSVPTKGAHYKSGVTCNFIVKTSNDYRIAVVFETLQFSATRGNCADFLAAFWAIIVINIGVNTVNILVNIVVSFIANFVNIEGNIVVSTLINVVVNIGIIMVNSSEAHEAGTAFCTFSQFKCANQRCVADNFACDGHNNCGDNSDENCDFKRSFWHDWGSTVLIGVIFVTLNVCAVGALLHSRRSSPPAEPEQPPTCVVQQPDGTFRNADATHSPGRWPRIPTARSRSLKP
ncbi:hypothetical protein MTO96_022352 [Rhipicephalus appendiculatus]